MTRCRLCLYPDTKPDLHFDADGVCSACRNYQNRPTIDWDARLGELEAILETGRNGSGYDCIVPSSGGKDSHWQVLTLIEMGARPLVVTATTDYLTPIGRQNIDNLARYATTIEVTPNRDVRAELCRLGLEMVGDPSWPEHASIFSVPFRMSVALGIPLVFYGESPQFEYGGPLGSDQARQMTRRWVSEYGGLLGLRPQDFHFAGKGVRSRDMDDYVLPDDNAMSRVSAYFLGQFLPWDSHRNAKMARDAGMTQMLPSRANWWEFENVDNALTGLHDHGMYRKFGYGRLAGQMSVDLRHGRIANRDVAMMAVLERDGLFPETYAGVEVDAVLRFLGVSRDWLMAALDKHTNWGLFSHVEAGRPILKEFAEQEIAA